MPEIAGKARGRPRLTSATAVQGAFARSTGTRHTVPRTKTAKCAALAAAIFMAGCSLDYQATEVEQQAAANIPDTVAVDLVHKIHKDGRLSIQLKAGRAESYDARKQTILADVQFIEYDDKGGKATEGRAPRVVFHSDTENAEVSGGVRVRSASEKAEVSGDSFTWENKRKKLTAPPDELVILKKEDGSSLSGRGFTGDFRTRQLTFTRPVEGRYVWEEKKE